MRFHRRVSEVCFSHRARVVIRQTSQLRSFWTMREHVCDLTLVWNRWPSFSKLRFSFLASARGSRPASVTTGGDVSARGFLQAFVSSERDYPKCAASSSTTSFENSSSNLKIVSSTSFSGTSFPLAVSCSLGLVSNDGVADCFVTATRNTKFVGLFVNLEVFSSVPRVGVSQLIVRVVQRTTLEDNMPPTPGCKPSLFGTDEADRGLNCQVFSFL